MTEPPSTPSLSTRDKLRRLAIALFVVGCLAGLGLAVAATIEVDAQGDAVVEREDPGDVAVSGDDDLIGQQPPGGAGTGLSEEDIVEQTIPAEGAEILQQQQIGIDLGDRFRVATLSVGPRGALRTIDEEHLVRRDELNQVFFQPSEGYEFEALPAGTVCGRAEVVRVTDPNDVVRSVEWCFEVT